MEYLTRDKFPVPVDRDAVRRDWRERGFSCDLFADPPGRAWLDFVHRTNELVTVIEGRLEMTVAGETFLVEPGDEIHIPRAARHSVHNLYKGETRWLFGYD